MESVVQGYSYANNLMVDSISNAIPVIDAETLEVDHYLFFAFVENAVKGFVNVYGKDSFTSNFIKTDVNIVEGDKINIFCKDNEVFFVNDEEFYHLGGEYNDLTGYSYPDCGQIEVECYEVESNNQNLTRANPVYYYSDVPFVANESTDGGIYVYGSSNIYMFRDSNESDGIISINVPKEALTDVTKVVYSDSHNVYPNWAGCIY